MLAAIVAFIVSGMCIAAAEGATQIAGGDGAPLHSSAHLLALRGADELAAAAAAGPLMVKFYAPWCGHCRRMAGLWDEFAELAFKEGAAYGVAAVDCTADENQRDGVCTAFGVRGYPTVALIDAAGSGFSYAYKRQRSIEELAAFPKLVLAASEAAAAAMERSPVPGRYAAARAAATADAEAPAAAAAADEL